MHIRDEHLRCSDTKDRLKRHFGRDRPLNTSTTGQAPASLASGSLTLPGRDLASPSGLSQAAPADNEADEFTSITNGFISMIDADEDPAPFSFPSRISIQLVDLFDHQSNHWVAMHKRSASRNFEEELEFYELTSLDAEGDIDVELDTTIESIFNV